MSMTTVSKTGRVYKRRFDHDECRELYATGEWTAVALANRYGVNPTRIDQIVHPEAKARADLRSAEWFKAICEDCGGDCVHNWDSPHGRHDRVVCDTCSGVRQREENLLARLDEAGDIRCVKCGGHHPIDMYRMDRGFPIGRCRPCETAARRDYRRSHLDEDRAAQRQYWRRRAAKK